VTKRRRLASISAPLALGLLALSSVESSAHDGPLAHNEFDKKIGELTELLKEDPSDKTALQERGYCYLQLREFESAVSDFDRLLELRAGWEPAILSRGYARLQMADLRGALADLERLCVPGQPKPIVAAWIYRGEVRHRLGDDRAALVDLDLAVAIAPKKWPPTFCLRGQVKANLGNEAGALDDFAAALALDTHHVDSLIARGRLHGEKERFREAFEDLGAASQYALDDGRPHAERAIIQRRRGFSLDAEPEANKAVELFRKEAGFARSNSRKAAILLEAARVTAEGRNRPRAALEILDEALVLAPERPDLLGYRVSLLETLGDKEELALASKRLLEVAKTKLPDGADVALVTSALR
jgi:tetratricopeptide (TPR) repeat protein